MRESENFAWNISQSTILGKGARGAVYRGSYKSTGETVAVKVLFSDGWKVPDISLRELEVLKRIDHENIVKIIAVEEEINKPGRRSPVIVMELCNGGSVLKMLQDPENNFGLPEDEFLIFFEDFYKGTKYLRDLGYVHRDLKPANIMKYVGDDGESVYKLIDFDAARELADNETYESINGTEEYLDPYIYEHAMIARQPNDVRKFTASTDLWSIGATLYHVATGRLPFRPFEGRKNTTVMLQMIGKKPSGVISAYQLQKNGQILQERELPKDCLLSPALQELLCPLISKLMESDPRKKIEYSHYFAQVQSILERKKAHVFFVNQVAKIRLYLDPNNGVGFPEELERWTGVKPEHQILFFKETFLKERLDTNEGYPIKSIPTTTEEIPIILCNRDDGEIQRQLLNPCFKKKVFPNMYDFHRDTELARYNCVVGHYIKRLIDGMVARVDLIDLVVRTINQAVISQLTVVSKDNQQIRSVVKSLNRQFEMMEMFHKSCKALLDFIPSTANRIDQLGKRVENMGTSYVSEFDEFQDLVSKLVLLKPSIESLLGSRVEKKNLVQEWEIRCEKTSNLKEIPKIDKSVSTILLKARTSYFHLTGEDDKLTKSSSSSKLEDDELSFLLMERIRMNRYMTKLEKLLDLCSSIFNDLCGEFSDWYKTAQVAFIQPDILANDIVKMRANLLFCEETLGKAFIKYRDEFSQFSTLISQPQRGTQTSKRNIDKNEKIAEGLTELKSIFEQMHGSLEENKNICKQIQSVILSDE